MANLFSDAVVTSLEQFNHDYGTAWDLGTNFSNIDTDVETYFNKYLLPKVQETTLVMYDLGNRFDFLAKEVEKIAQFSEEMVILDTIPVGMNLSKPQEQLLTTNFPKMAVKIFGQGQYKKMKFTLDSTDTRHNFSTLKDAVAWVIGVYKKKISDINVSEESEIKAMLVDYSLNHVKEQRTVSSMQELTSKVTTALLNLQNNTSKYNETSEASGGGIGRFTSHTNLNDVCILTNDDVKSYLLDTKIANTFTNEGIDFTSKIISFDDLGGVFKVTDDITISDVETLKVFKAYGDYQISMGDVLIKDTILTFDVSELSEFKNNVIEVKPESELYAYIFDIRKVRYGRNTKGMLKTMENPEFLHANHWLHYFSRKQMSPFYNSILITE